MSYADIYNKLNGRPPKHEDILRHERLMALLNAPHDDAFMSILVALDYFQTLYSAIPNKIREASAITLNDFRTTANMIATASMEQTKSDMTTIVGKLANDVAANVVGRQKAKWVAFATVAITASLIAVFWFGYAKSEEGSFARGMLAGQALMREEHALATWGNTPQGRQAYKLAQAGNIDNLIHCNQPGWSINEETNVCVVRPVNGSIYGWALPPQEK